MRKYRAQPRNDASGSAELHWQIGAGYVRSTLVTVQDISVSGMGLHSPIPFAIGSALQIKTGNQLRFVTVRRCFRAGAQHFLGVEFDDSPEEGYRSSPVVIPRAGTAVRNSRQ
jgi:hypothetical protein